MKYEEIVPVLDRLTEMKICWSLGISESGVGRLWIGAVKQTHEHYRPVLSMLTSFFGRLNKEVKYGMQSWTAEKDGATLSMYNVAQCKVVGYRTVEKKKVVEVETEEIETEEQPIYDCSETE